MSEHQAYRFNDIESEVRFFQTGQVPVASESSQRAALGSYHDHGRIITYASQRNQDRWDDYRYDDRNELNRRAEAQSFESSTHDLRNLSGSSSHHYSHQNDYQASIALTGVNAPVDIGRDLRWTTSYATTSAYRSGPENSAVHPPQRGHSSLSTTDIALPPVLAPSGTITIRPKRKKADAQQLQILNETYARTHFPTTEERLYLSQVLDMSPRSVQIWFQNKRVSMGHTRQPASPNTSRTGNGDDSNRTHTTSPYAAQSSASMSRRRLRKAGGPEAREDHYGLR